MIVSEKKKHIDQPQKVADMAREVIDGYDVYSKDKVHFFVIGLNNKNVAQYIDLVSIGTVSESIVHPREVYRMAILKACSGIVVAHNHPSSVLTLSKEDIAATDRLKNAGQVLGIPVIDHVIIGDKVADGRTEYLSMKEEGYI